MKNGNEEYVKGYVINLTVVSSVSPTDLRWVDAAHPRNCHFVAACRDNSRRNRADSGESRHCGEIKPANSKMICKLLLKDKIEKPPQLADVVVHLVHSEGASASSGW